MGARGNDGRSIVVQTQRIGSSKRDFAFFVILRWVEKSTRLNHVTNAVRNTFTSKQLVVGSSPTVPLYGDVVQLAEQPHQMSLHQLVVTLSPEVAKAYSGDQSKCS